MPTIRKVSENENLISGEEAWEIMQSFHIRSEDFKKEYEIFYRSTEYCPRDSFLNAEFSWCMWTGYTTDCSIGVWTKNAQKPNVWGTICPERWILEKEKCGNVWSIVLIKKKTID